MTGPEKENSEQLITGRVTENWPLEQAIWFIIINVVKNINNKRIIPLNLCRTHFHSEVLGPLGAHEVSNCELFILFQNNLIRIIL